eukprot:3476425-Ditylum_brightwellii.AAC.1
MKSSKKQPHFEDHPRGPPVLIQVGSVVSTLNWQKTCQSAKIDIFFLSSSYCRNYRTYFWINIGRLQQTYIRALQLAKFIPEDDHSGKLAD